MKSVKRNRAKLPEITEILSFPSYIFHQNRIAQGQAIVFHEGTVPELNGSPLLTHFQWINGIANAKFLDLILCAPPSAAFNKFGDA